MSSNTAQKDIATRIFIELDDMFFDNDGNPRTFHLRDKKNVQDDPFDEYIQKKLGNRLDELEVQGSSPLVSPDIVALDTNEILEETGKIRNLNKITSVEVKKLERTDAGNIARSSGLDYNSTPPCGTIRVYKSNGENIDIHSFYFFACLEQTDPDEGMNKVSAFVLCDGDVLNENFELYKSVAIDSREKEIGLGTYGDGMDRQRPMFVFPNPLGADSMDNEATFIHASPDLDSEISQFSKIHKLIRSNTGNDGPEHERIFYTYRTGKVDGSVEELRNPFPTPTSRSSSTQSRGTFTLESI